MDQNFTFSVAYEEGKTNINFIGRKKAMKKKLKIEKKYWEV